MSEASITPFPAPAGLETFGSADAEAGVCVDGVCIIPPAGSDDSAGDESGHDSADDDSEANQDPTA